MYAPSRFFSKKKTKNFSKIKEEEFEWKICVRKKYEVDVENLEGRTEDARPRRKGTLTGAHISHNGTNEESLLHTSLGATQSEEEEKERWTAFQFVIITSRGSDDSTDRPATNH